MRHPKFLDYDLSGHEERPNEDPSLPFDSLEWSESHGVRMDALMVAAKLVFELTDDELKHRIRMMLGGSRGGPPLCRCGSEARHHHVDRPCCGGVMCCAEGAR